MSKQILAFEDESTTYAYRLHTESRHAERESFAVAVLDLATQLGKELKLSLDPSDIRKLLVPALYAGGDSVREVYAQMMTLVERAKNEPIIFLVREGENMLIITKFYYFFLVNTYRIRDITMRDPFMSPETDS